MQTSTVVVGTIGAIVGGLAGLYVGEKLKKNAGADMMPELLTILGGITGGVVASSLHPTTASAAATPPPTSTSTTPAV